MAALFILVIGFFAWLMISRRLTATLALPLTAFAVAALALIGPALHDGLLPAANTFLTTVVEEGITRLAGAIFAVILGAVLAAQMRISGAAERLVRYAAEYSGEDRFSLGLMLLIVTAVLFTTLGGLGAVILVASVTLPLMFSLGFEPKVAGGLFLLGLSLGGCLNPVNWQLYVDVLKLSPAEIIPFAVLLAAMFFVVCCAFLFYHLQETQDWLRKLLPLGLLLLFAAVAGMAITRLPDVWTATKQILAWTLGLLALILIAAIICRLILLLVVPVSRSWHAFAAPDNWLAGASMLLPLLILLWSSLAGSLATEGQTPFSVPINTALLLGIIACALASYAPDGASANRTMQALFEAVGSAGPAVVLLIGIGLLLKATTLPAVGESFAPWLQLLPVGTALGFVATFFILSPLALYRGPLNLYGMGSGVVGIISGSMILAGTLVMSAFFSVGMLQGVCDPTNTHNVWVANYCKVPVNELTRLTAGWVLAVVLLGLVAGSVMFHASF